ncbi:MAG TPA: hypothetical protein HA349_10220 [Methanotrichaceae archaeon]|nr:hypothetical protein [Methanotrichaceae archaeon]
MSLDLDQPLVGYGSSVTYTLHLKNSGLEALTDISVTDNFGQAGFLARLPKGESFDLTRTTPPLKSSTQLKVVANSGGEEICRAEATVQVGLPEDDFSIPELEFAEPMAWEDQTLNIMSASPEIELVVGADPNAVQPGEKTTVRMTVTNRCSQPLRDVEITGPGWTVEAGDLKPDESKTYSRTLTIAEDISTDLTATGTADGGETATDQERLEVSTVSSDLSVTVIYTPASSDRPATTEYRLKNEGVEVLSRVTLKDGRGDTLGILPQLGPGESKSLTGTANKDTSGPIEVTAVSPEGKTATGEVIVQPATTRPGTTTVQQPTSKSSSSKSSSRTFESMGFGTETQFDEMDLELNFDEIGPDLDIFGTTSEASGLKESRSADGPELQDISSDAGFGNFDMGFDFGDFEFGKSSDLVTTSTGSKTETETGSPNLVVTLQVNRTQVHKGEMVRYRCTAVNRGTASLDDVEIRCGEKTATSPHLAPGDGLPLEGAMRADGSLNLTAAALASGPDGSKLTDEAFLQIKVVSPDLKIEVSKDPEEICRGQRVSIVVRLENSGDDALSDVRVADALGEIGKISVLEPGEARTLMRNSTLDESLEDVVRVIAIDSTGSRLQRSKTLNFELLEPSLDLTVDPRKAAAYPGEAVEVVWTIRNTGETDLVDVTFEGEGASQFRLPAVAAGGSTPISSTYFADRSREVTGRAEGRTTGSETVSDTAAFEIRMISPGISLNVKPSEVEACPEKVFNLSCLVTNSGDDLLKDVILSEKSLGTLEKIGRLEPGDFKVVTIDFFAETNTTFRLEVKGTDSRGKTWTDSQNVAMKLVSANIELSVRADPPETTPGSTVNVVCTVENQGNVPIFSTFIMGRSLEHLGTIDYISPGSSRKLEKEIEVSEEIEDEITAEGFTRDRTSVKDQEILQVRLIEPQPPYEKVIPAEVSESASTSAAGIVAKEAREVGVAETKYQEEVGLGEMVNKSKAGASEIRENDSSNITGLMNRLREILEKIRLNKQSSAKTTDATSSESTMPAGSEPASYSGAPPSASLPGTPTQWAGYGTHEGDTNTSPLSPDDAILEGAGYTLSTEVPPTVPATSETGPGTTAGYAYSDGGPTSGNLSSLGPSPETAGYSYSAEGLSSSYLSSPWISPGYAGYAYSASDPASAYLSSPWTSPGSAGYASSDSGPFSALTSPAGILPTLAGSATPTSYDNADTRSASEASPKVAESKASTEYSSRHRYSEVSPGYAEAAAPAGSLSLDSPSQSKSPSKNIKLVIGDPSTLEVDHPPRIIDVGAFPPEPTTWSPVVVAVHASDDIGIKSVDMLWDTPSTAVSRLDLADITKINSQKMELEEGDLKEGYWSYEIPGQAAGTYMAVFIKVSDGERWAEDGPYILFWSGTASENEAVQPAAQETTAEDGRRGKTVENQKNGMLFVESTTVIGRGDVSIKNEFRESNARYKEELDGRGSIEMKSEKTINKGNPIVNITDCRLLVFDQGYLKGFKVMQSPNFHGGMGASVTERFNATTLEKSETGTISSVNRSENTLLFNTQQAFEGIWGTNTEYSNFNKKIKARQQLTGTFETQKKITFED